MIPTEKDWTVIFSAIFTQLGQLQLRRRRTTSLRFTATPRPRRLRGAARYRFENLADNSATAILHWEKLEIPFTIDVDTKAVVLESLKSELHGLAQFSWQPLEPGRALVRAATTTSSTRRMTWADQSIAMQANFQNLRTKAAHPREEGRREGRRGAAGAGDEARDRGRHQRLRLPAPRADRRPTRRSRSSARTSRTIPTPGTVRQPGRGPAAKGDKKAAIENYTKASRHGHRPANKKRITDILARLKVGMSAARTSGRPRTSRLRHRAHDKRRPPVTALPHGKSGSRRLARKPSGARRRGGRHGVNAVLETDLDTGYTIVVLSNLDPPSPSASRRS